MPDLHLVVLAAGKGTRMKSGLPKVLHRAGDFRLIEHVLRASASLQPRTTIVIVGHMADEVRRSLPERLGLRFALQEPQLGTGHAMLQAEPHLAGAGGTVVLLSGDVPLLRPATLRTLVETHERSGATAAERTIDEINSGIYAFAAEGLFEALRSIGSANAQGEYYLPDLVRIYRERGLEVDTVQVGDPREILGVNSRGELADVAAILKSRKNEELMAAGVSIVDPASAWIGPDVTIGADTVIHPNVYLEGQTRIGERCEIHASVRIVDSTLEDGVVINNFCVIRESHVRAGAQIGPFAHIRPQSDVGEGAHVGNFTELKKTTLGKGSKANHLSYLGDATIGEKVNVGAGTITCNYDGTHKHPTVIEDGAFIGSDSQLVAPVRIGKGAYVAAGSSIVEDVPAGALGIARGKQVNKDGWVGKKKKG
jgi:bifunctional UDP-N-acetylglucosamine pyrophosphorylase/glucosamine-1-phosphate N-acetyltransferase